MFFSVHWSFIRLRVVQSGYCCPKSLKLSEDCLFTIVMGLWIVFRSERFHFSASCSFFICSAETSTSVSGVPHPLVCIVLYLVPFILPWSLSSFLQKTSTQHDDTTTMFYQSMLWIMKSVAVPPHTVMHCTHKSSVLGSFDQSIFLDICFSCTWLVANCKC